MKQKVYEIKLQKENSQEKIDIEIPPKYENFKDDMLKRFSHPKTTKYIYTDDINVNHITIDSSSSYNQMLERLNDLPSSVTLKVKNEQDHNDIFKKMNEEKDDRIQNSKQKEQNQILFVNEKTSENLQLPPNYEQFQKKMKNKYGFETTTKYIYAADDDEIILDSSSSYDQVLQNQQKKTRTLKVKDDDESDSKYEWKDDYTKLFKVADRKIDCVCKVLGRDVNKCSLCNGTTLIDYSQQQGWCTELNKEFGILLKKNFQKIKKYIKDNYKKDIKTVSSWKEFQLKLVDFQDQEEFYFKCIDCGKFYYQANIVHVKSKQRPQQPLCDQCFKSNRMDGYITLRQNKSNQEDDQLGKPPNLMQSSH